MKLKNVVGLALLFAMMFSLSACTDYEGVVDDKYEEWKANIKYGSLTDSRDGQVYKTITIGTQTWMAENLNYETGNSWCYDNKASNCTKYGRLYTWSAVMDSVAQFSENAGTKCGYGETCTPNSPHRGICPDGWHVPTNEEYSALYTYVGGSSVDGSMLKSTSGWYSSGNGSDKYGFSVLPAGLRDANGDFRNEGYFAFLWSASEYYSYDAGSQFFGYDCYFASQYYDDKDFGRSLRCLKDSSPTSGAATSSSSQAQPSSSSSSIKDGSDYDAVASTLTDLRDGQVYKTVTIGTQTWMAENLNYAYTGVKYNYSSYTSDSTSWCYENKASNCDKYGRLYTWSAVMDSAAQFNVNAGTKCGYGKTCTPNSPHRGICPEGWHVPTNEEYSTLYTYIGGSSTAGSLLKSTSGWNNGGNGSDKYGFSVLPAGYRRYGGYFYDEGDYANLWSASENGSNYAWGQRFYYDKVDGAYSQYYYYKYYGQSLRCLKDSSPTSGAATSSSSQAQPSSSSSEVIPSSSSSVILSSSSEGSSSSFKASWTYLNPDIDYGEMTDTRDNQVYKTVTIGTQTWMAENLNYKTRNSSCYENKPSNCTKYGRLYTWSAVMDSAAQFSENAGTKCGSGKTCTPNSPHRGICPVGWHVPTSEEYGALCTYIGGFSTAGSLLKSTSGWNNGGNGSDKYGFSVLPAGYSTGYCYNEGRDTYLWSASDRNSGFAWSQYFSYNHGDAYQDGYSKNIGQSLRCLKDSSPTSGAATSSSSQAQPSSSSFVSSSSSSNVIPDPESSSSIASSSSAKSSSSIASSSSVKSSSSVASSSSLKAAWTYLNPSVSYGEIVDSRDNQVYKTVTIGTQTWMAENLNYAYTGVKYNYNDNTSDSTSWCHDNLASSCSKYGRLYTWSAVMDSAALFSENIGTKCGYGKTCTPNSPHRGICPEGWHVPTNEEYSTLYTYIGGTSTAGSLLKSTSGWNGTDKYGFSVLPAGYRSDYGDVDTEGIDAYLWSASESNSSNVWYQYFYRDNDQDDGCKYFGRSLRCLKDND